MKKATEARSDELAARVKALTDKLESGVKDVFESDAYKSYLTAMSKLTCLKATPTKAISPPCPSSIGTASETSY